MFELISEGIPGEFSSRIQIILGGFCVRISRTISERIRGRFLERIITEISERTFEAILQVILKRFSKTTI